MCGRTCKQYIVRSYSTSTFNGISFDENSFTFQCEKEDKNAHGFKILQFYWSFSSETMAVKGLKQRTRVRSPILSIRELHKYTSVIPFRSVEAVVGISGQRNSCQCTDALQAHQCLLFPNVHSTYQSLISHTDSVGVKHQERRRNSQLVREFHVRVVDDKNVTIDTKRNLEGLRG